MATALNRRLGWMLIGVAILHSRIVAQQSVDPLRLIGLLTLPQVFGAGPCVPFTPSAIPLVARPGATDPVASLLVEKPAAIHPDGGCDALSVQVRRANGSAMPLPTEEYDYEAPAAIVTGRDGDWFQLRTSEGPLWMRAGAANQFLSLTDLLSSDRLTYVTANWDGALLSTPGGARMATGSIRADSIVHVLGTEQRGDVLWLQIEAAEGCADAVKPPPTRGWVRAYGRDDRPAVWFFSRGC